MWWPFKKSDNEVLFIYRKPYSTGNYSVERLFGDIQTSLSDVFSCERLTVRHFSKGLFRRLLICFEVFFKQAKVNLITGDISFVALFLPKKSSILVILDCGFLYETKGVSRWLQELLWARLPVKRAGYVIAISDATKSDVVKITGCNPDKIKVIPCFIEEHYSKSEKVFPATIPPVLLQVGQAANKNLIRIAQAIEGMNVHLCIIGELTKDVHDLLQGLSIDYAIHTNLTKAEMLKKYIESDVLVFPSTYEGFGLPILEAQTVGRVVVTSNITCMPWVAGEGACLVDPYSVTSIRDGIERVINDCRFREMLIERGYENVLRFERSTIVGQYESLCRLILHP